MSGLSAGTAWVAVKPLADKKSWASVGKITAVGLALAGAGATAASREFLKFDDSMNSSLAIMDEISGPMRKKMERAAREVGKTTRFSAGQAAEAYFFLASAGMDAQQSIKAMPAVAAFAAAGNFDLAKATDLATDAQSALGLAVKDPEKNLRNLTRVTDVFVKANTLANTSVEQISEAMTNKAGAAMRALDMDIESGAAVLAAFADQGVKGREAGTQFAIVLRDLQTRALSNADAFKDAGIQVFDANGNFRNMADIMADLEGHLDGMSDAQKRAALSALGFSDRSMGSLSTLMGTSDAIREYESELRNAGGTTEDVAKKQMRSFQARLDIVKSKVADFGITAGRVAVEGLFALGGGFKDGAVQGRGFNRALSVVGAGLRKATDFADRLFEGFRTGIRFVQRFGDVFLAVGGLVLLAMTPWLAQIALLNIRMGLLIIRTTVMSAVTGAWTAAQWLLNAALSANPLGIVILAIAALAAGVVIAYRRSETFRKVVDKTWSVVQGAVTGAWGKIRPILRAIVGFVGGRLVKTFNTWWSVTSFVMRSIWEIIKFGWDVQIRPVFRALSWFVSNVLGPAVSWLWDKVFKPVFNHIKAVVPEVWRRYVRPPLVAMRDFVRDTLAPAFKSGMEAIGDAWSSLKALAAKPVNFVIETVYNDGIRKLFNSVAGALKSSATLPPASKISVGGAGGAGHAHAHGAHSAMGGPLSWAKDTAGKGLDWLRGKAGDTVKPLIDKIGTGPFAGLLKDAARNLLGIAVGSFRGDKQLRKGTKGRVLPAGAYRVGMPYLGYPGHFGADYPAATGTPVSAMTDGVVSRAASLTGSYGKHVFIDHPGGIQTRYAHLSALGVKPGQKVSRGAQIGRVGSTGNSTGPHLHFEYRKGGRSIDPAGLHLFDSGGMLSPGFSAVYNGTRKPEAVFTHEQFRTLENIANQRGGRELNVHNHFPTTDPNSATAASRQTTRILAAEGI